MRERKQNKDVKGHLLTPAFLLLAALALAIPGSVGHLPAPTAELVVSVSLQREVAELRDLAEGGACRLLSAVAQADPLSSGFVGVMLRFTEALDRVSRDALFCGVRFMAETAKILAPEKTVLLPALEAGCSLAAGITADDVRRLKKQFPGVPVVSYVNTYADVKAESDACCTSSNAAAIVEAFDSDAVIFLPDEYLARNVARQTGRRIIIPTPNRDQTRNTDGCVQHTLIGWNAKCEVHEKFEVDDIRRIRRRYPDVAVLAHPECSPDVIEAADFSGSTSAMIRFVRESGAPRYLLLTECCMGDNIAADNPEKEMLRLCSVRCPHMNEITLEQTLASLKENRHEIEVPPDVLHRARRAIDRMIAIGPPRNTVASRQSKGAPICN